MTEQRTTRRKPNRIQEELLLGNAHFGQQRYLVVERLGAHGRVRKAFDAGCRPRQMRAIRELPRCPETFERLAFLSRASQSDSFPLIVGSHPSRDKVYVVSQWIEGESLQKYLDQVATGRRPALSPYEAVRLFLGLARGLRRLHRKAAIFHGDIKPDNIILAPDKNRLVLVDFGNAWGLEQMNRKDAGDGVSERHFAPEVLDGHPGSFAADQFSATVVFYEMLTGEIPYGRLGGLAAQARKAGQPGIELVEPSRCAHNAWRVPSRLWKRIDAVAQRGLQLDASERYSGADAWINDLGQLFDEMREQPRINGANKLVLRAINKVIQLVGLSNKTK